MPGVVSGVHADQERLAELAADDCEFGKIAFLRQRGLPVVVPSEGAGQVQDGLDPGGRVPLRIWPTFRRFFRSALSPVMRRINGYLVRWAMLRYKRLRAHPRRARAWLVAVFRRQPDLFEHWRAGLRPVGWTVGAV